MDAYGGAAIELKAYEFDVKNDDGEVIGTAFDCAHLALGGIQACKPVGFEDQPVHNIRTLPSTLEGLTVEQCASHQALMWQGLFRNFRTHPSIPDIFAVQLAGNWQDIDLPRKYSLGSGSWHSLSTWVGNRIPNSGSDVFIVNQQPLFENTQVDVTGNGAAKSLFVSDENRLRILGSTLTFGDTVTVAGPGTTAGPLRPVLPDSEPGDPPIGIEGASSTVLVGAGATLQSIDMVVEPGARFELDSTGLARVGTLRNSGVISGTGSVRIGSILENRRIISAKGGTLTFFTPPADEVIAVPVLDLDGPFSPGDRLASIQAIDGDLVFDAIIADAVGAAIVVRSGRSITFTNGWQQAFSSAVTLPMHRLSLEGGAAGATIHGASTLGGRTFVEGIGRFTSSVSFGPTAELRLRIAGSDAGTQHDQLQISQNTQLAGKLDLRFTGGFQPGFNDTFVLMTYSGHIGEFDTIEILNIEDLTQGGLVFSLDYRLTEIVLSVGLEGGTPGAANCVGETATAQAAIHGGTKSAAEFHGFASVKAYMDALQQFCMA